MTRDMKWVSQRVEVASSGCWVWTGSKGRRGYGVFDYPNGNRKSTSAHRFVYLSLGISDAEGKDIHHLCDNPPCVNPSHLTEMTRDHHMSVTLNFPRTKLRNRTHCKNGHALAGNNIYFAFMGAKKYKVRRCRACKSYHQKMWKSRELAKSEGQS